MKINQNLYGITPTMKISEKEMKTALTLLSKDERQILEEYYGNQKSIREIATDLNCSVSTIYSKLNKGIFRLRKILNPSSLYAAYLILYSETTGPSFTASSASSEHAPANNRNDS